VRLGADGAGSLGPARHSVLVVSESSVVVVSESSVVVVCESSVVVVSGAQR
jgi:hypothetical protein